MEQIYTITTFQKIVINEFNLPEFGDKRCIGYTTNLDEAKVAVESNLEDIHDGMYDYVIIEELLPGIKIQDTARWLYKWEGNEYKKIDIPQSIEHLSNFGIG